MEEYMGSKMIPNYNQVELAFLAEFIEGTIELAEELAGEIPNVEHIRESIRSFHSLLVSGFTDDNCGRIILVEDFRNDLLELILDRLDDNLNLYVSDVEGDLALAGLTSEQAIRSIPTYRASVEILGELVNGEPDFHTRRAVAGHVWDEEHIRMLMNRFESGEFQQQAELLGIAERLSELRAVDHKQEMLIQDCKVGELMDEIRSMRRHLHTVIMELYSKIYRPEDLLKRQNIVSGVELVIEILKSEQQNHEDLQFSANDLSHSEFVSYATEKYPDEQLCKELRSCWSALCSEESWRNFEQSELILYRTMERFFRDITIHLLHIESIQNHPLRSKIETSDHYRNASALLEKLIANGVTISADFSRGWPVCDDTVIELVMALRSPEFKDLLTSLRLRSLAVEICEAEAKSREFSALAVRRNRDLTLDRFRKIRADLTRAFHSIRKHL